MKAAGATRGHRILFLLSSLRIGGSERKTVRLANALSARGQDVLLAYLNAPETLLSELRPAVKAVHLRRTGKFSLGALRRLRATIEAHRVDTVVGVNLYAALYAGLLARFSRRLEHVQFVASINTTHFSSGKAEAKMLLYRPLLRSMDLLVFGAEYQRAIWQRDHLGPGAPRSCVLYNGVDMAHFRSDKVTAWRPAQWPAGRVIVGAVGMLRPEKSYDHLLRAIAQLYERGLDVGAVIVGEGTEEAALRRVIAELRLEDRVHLGGAVRDVRPHLAGFDVFVTTSTAVETFSNAALEALAMECPVIASRVGGMPEMLATGGGAIYQTGNVAELVELLYGLVSNPQRRAVLAKQARNVVAQRFSLDTMVETFQAEISGGEQRALRKSGPPAAAREYDRANGM